MLVLALDTAFGACSVALLDFDKHALREDQHLIVKTQRMERGQSEVLIPMVEALLEEARCELKNIDRFAVTLGPGSFTGIRIALSAARGFGMVFERPVIGISTLAALAAPFLLRHDQVHVATVIDARHGMVFFQLTDSTGHVLLAPGLYKIEDAAYLIGAERTMIVGNAAEALYNLCRKLFPRVFGNSMLFVPVEHVDIGWVARLGALSDPDHAVVSPLYLREVQVTLPTPAGLVAESTLSSSTPSFEQS